MQNFAFYREHSLSFPTNCLHCADLTGATLSEKSSGPAFFCNQFQTNKQGRGTESHVGKNPYDKSGLTHASMQNFAFYRECKQLMVLFTHSSSYVE
jgi:hypothetical protein